MRPLVRPAPALVRVGLPLSRLPRCTFFSTPPPLPLPLPPPQQQQQQQQQQQLPQLQSSHRQQLTREQEFAAASGAAAANAAGGLSLDVRTPYSVAYAAVISPFSRDWTLGFARAPASNLVHLALTLRRQSS